MLKGEDIVLLLKLAGAPPDWTLRSLEDQTNIPRSVVQRAVKRLAEAGLLDERHRRVNVSQAEEFLLHGMRYVFPGVLGGDTRGVPTAWAVEPLRDRLSSGSADLPPVWPDADGDRRGLALRPLHASVVEAARRDAQLGERLALADALRIGDARVRALAGQLLSERLDAARPTHRIARLRS